jgi:DNA-binding NtrC family response regulator
MKDVLQQIELVRNSGVAVLVRGEPGSGKTTVAATIHETGARSGQPFVQIDCSEVPAEILEAVLFGERDEGRLELAAEGTLFLKGIDTLPLDAQERLVRILETGVVERSNGERIVPIRARVIASTKRNLRDLVGNGEFRKDLFCRLNVFPIALPALRDRKDDVPPLAQLFLERHRHERTPAVRAIEEAALLALKAYAWPGNVRELEMIVLGAILASGQDGVVRVAQLPANIRSNAPKLPETSDVPAPIIDPDDNTIVPLAELERRAIAHALRVTGGNVTRAARALGIGRATMYRKLDRFKIVNS